MKTPRLALAMGYIDDKLVSGAIDNKMVSNYMETMDSICGLLVYCCEWDYYYVSD